MSREDPQMKIRLPASLKATVEKEAQASGRTMNAEIVARLERSFEQSAQATDTTAALRDLRVHLELQNDLIWGFIQQAVAMLEGGGTKAQAKAMLDHVNTLITKRTSLADPAAFEEAFKPLEGTIDPTKRPKSRRPVQRRRPDIE